jgi:hypothetical protein
VAVAPVDTETRVQTRSDYQAQPDRAIDEVLDDLEEGKIIPVLGSDLFSIEVDGSALPQNVAIARATARRLGLDDADSIGSLNEVFVRHLRQGIPEEVYEAIEKASRQTPLAPMPWLVDFTAISGIRLFITTSFLDQIEQAVARARGLSPDVKVYARSQFDDLEPTYENIRTPVVYHLFGRVSSFPNYVASEQDALEFLASLQDRNYQPAHLFDALRANNLLLLGCRFPDWVTRFFLRGLAGKSLLEDRRSRKYLIDAALLPDEPLVMFLSRFSYRTSMVATDPIAFIQKLSDRWKARQGATAPVDRANEPLPRPANTNDAQGAIFVSYASEDREAAKAVVQMLEEQRIPVWYDRQRLAGGTNWDQRIEQAISGCAYFMPLVSRTTDQLFEGYFRKEWKLAVDRSSYIDESVPFVLPLLIDDASINSARVPAIFRKRQAMKALGGRIGEDDVRHIVTLMREYRLRQETALR